MTLIQDAVKLGPAPQRAELEANLQHSQAAAERFDGHPIDVPALQE